MRIARMWEEGRAPGSATLAVLGSAVCLAVLAGCGTGALTTPDNTPTALVGPALQGKVFGGQQPVVGAAIQLYAAGTSGYGSTAAALLPTGSVVTVAGGNFDITGKYTCPANSLVYIVATGGNSGSGTNANLAMMTALGSCSNLQANASTTFISINELTTVGSVWALAPFMTGIANIGTSATNTMGLLNAFADVNTLTDTSKGVAPGPAVPGGATVPVAEINTLADILAVCINSAGATASTTPCGMLFAAATPQGGTAPTDTITAAMDIAQHPGQNPAGLFVLSTPTAPFQPTLTTPPNDFTIAVNYTGGSFGGPSALAVDASGNLWVTNGTGNTVTELSHAGAVLSGAGYTASLSGPSAVAIDAAGYVWVTNRTNSTVSRLTSSGGVSPGSPFSGGGLNLPQSIAFDSQGNAWIGNDGNTSVTMINSTGSTLANYVPGSVANPIGIAVTPR